MNYTRLSQLLSHMLRHAPEQYNLQLNPDGWADLEAVLAAINREEKFRGATVADIEKAMADSDKKRHELAGNKIRAAYGHSLKQKIEMDPAEPPATLYHGTARRYLASILKDGLSPKNRQYVHLSTDRETASTVGGRRDEKPVVLMVKAGRAWRDGHKFYRAEDKIWLADAIPTEYISLEDS